MAHFILIFIYTYIAVIQRGESGKTFIFNFMEHMKGDPTSTPRIYIINNGPGVANVRLYTPLISPGPGNGCDVSVVINPASSTYIDCHNDLLQSGTELSDKG